MIRVWLSDPNTAEVRQGGKELIASLEDIGQRSYLGRYRERAK